MKKLISFFTLFLLFLITTNYSYADSNFNFDTPIAINWQDDAQSFLKIRHFHNRASLVQCLESGLKLNILYRFEVCKHRPFWLDPCLDELRHSKTLAYNAIEQVYTLIEAASYKSEAIISEYDTLESALVAFLELKELELSKISLGSDEFRLSQRAYISIKVNAVCQGRSEDLSEVVAGLLTLGILNVNEYESSWYDFRLYKKID